MAVTKTTSKTQAQTKPVLTPANKPEIIVQAEEFILIYQQLMKHDAFELMKNYEAIKKKLQEHAIAAGTDPKAPYVYHTDKGDITFKAAAESTVITDLPGIRKALGPDLFMELAKVGITDLKKYLGEIELAKFTEKVNGSRALASVNPS